MSEGMQDVPTANVGRKIADEIETDSFGVSNKDATARKINAALSSSQARLSEAVKVLEEMSDLLEGGESGFVSCSGPDEVWKRLRDQSVSKARVFLATLGEER